MKYSCFKQVDSRADDSGFFQQILRQNVKSLLSELRKTFPRRGFILKPTERLQRIL